MNSIRRIGGIVIVSGMLAVLGGMSDSAEVGAYVHTDGSASVYELNIVDDPEPVGTSWIRYFSDSPQRFVLNQWIISGDAVKKP